MVHDAGKSQDLPDWVLMGDKMVSRVTPASERISVLVFSCMPLAMLCLAGLCL